MPLIPKTGRNKPKIKALLIGISAILWLGIFLHLFPVWWMFVTSIKPEREVFMFPPSLWPKTPTFAIYKMMFYLTYGGWGPVQYPFYVYFKNSAIMTGSIVIIQVCITSLVAYSLSKLFSARWSRILFLFFIGTMLVPGTISLIPRYLMISHFPFLTKKVPNIPFTNYPFPSHSFLESYWAVILPLMYAPFSVLLFKGYFDGIPNELINAARLDGASEFGIFRRIILPLSKPVFAVISYFAFAGAWNQFIWPLITLRTNKLWPISVLLYQFQWEMQRWRIQASDPQAQRLMAQGIGYNGIMVVAIIESIPVFIMFVIFREQLMKGIKLRGFK